jgi:hypothetical protein
MFYYRNHFLEQKNEGADQYQQKENDAHRNYTEQFHGDPYIGVEQGSHPESYQMSGRIYYLIERKREERQYQGKTKKPLPYHRILDIPDMDRTPDNNDSHQRVHN